MQLIVGQGGQRGMGKSRELGQGGQRGMGKSRELLQGEAGKEALSCVASLSLYVDPGQGFGEDGSAGQDRDRMN
jgi:hypothetical protein